MRGRAWLRHMVFAIVVDTKLHFLGSLENASMEFPLVFAELLSCGPGPGSTSAAPGIFKGLAHWLTVRYF